MKEYNLNCKKGMSWTERKIVLDNQFIKYFKPKNTTPKFSVKIIECILKEETSNKKYFLTLISKNKTFKDISISHENLEYIRRFKNDFDCIKNNLSSDLIIKENKFIDESQKKFISDIVEKPNKEEILHMKEELKHNQSNIFRDYEDDKLIKENEFNIQSNENEEKNEKINESVIKNDIHNENEEKNVNLNNIEGIDNQTNDNDKNEEINFKYEVARTTESIVLEEEIKEEKLAIPLINKTETEIIIKDESENNKPEYKTEIVSKQNYISSIISLNYTILKHSNNCIIEFYGKNKTIFTLIDNEKCPKISDESMYIIKKYQMNALYLLLLSLFLIGIVSFSFSFFLFALFLAITIISIFLYISKNTSNEPIENELLFEEEVIKVSAFIDENSTEIDNYFNNYLTYKDWNKYLIGIADFKKDEFSAIHSYFKTSNCDRDIQLKIFRKKKSNMLLDYIDNELIRLTLFEYSRKNRKTKVSIFLPLINISKNKVPITFIESNLLSLDLLILFINNKKFNNPDDKKESISEIENVPFETRKKSKAIYRKSINKSINTFDFYDMGNRFSINEREETIIKPEENKEIKLVSKPNPFDEEDKEIKNIIQIRYKEFQECFYNTWKIMEEKNDYKLFYYDEKSGLRSIKAESEINKNYRTVMDYILNFDNKANYDKNFDTGHTIRLVDDEYSIQYLKYKGKMFISPRDFVIISYKKITDDEILIFASSYDSDKYPKNNKIERADLKYGCYVLKRLDDFKTHLTFYSLADIRLSQTLVNTTLKELAMSVKYIKDQLENK